MKHTSQETDSRSNVIRSKLLPPLLIRRPHLLCLGEVKLASPQEPKEGRVVEPVILDPGGQLGVVRWDQALGEEFLPELGEGGFLGGVAVGLALVKGARVRGRRRAERVGLLAREEV